MKIIIYTITDCQFSKQEKEYLASHQLQYEEKNLETNKDWLTEMLAVSNNFAGTPVTKIEKDDGNIVVLKGFTKEEFDTTLGFTSPNNQSPITNNPVRNASHSDAGGQTPNNNQNSNTQDPNQTIPPIPTISDDLQPVSTNNPSVQGPLSNAPNAVPPAPPVVPEPTVIPPATPPAQTDPLASVLEDLQTKVASDATKVDEIPPTPTASPVTPAESTPAPNPGLPNIPDFNKQI